MKNKLDQLLINSVGQKLQSELVESLWKSIDELPLIANDEEVLFYEFKQSGISCLFNVERVLEAIHLFGENREGFLAYRDLLPHEITFQNSKAEIVQKLGKPSVEGGGKPSLLGGKISPWIKYLYPNYQFHLQFDESLTHIVIVTLMIPSLI